MLIAKPMSSSMVTHNGEQGKRFVYKYLRVFLRPPPMTLTTLTLTVEDAIIYAVSGNGVLATHSGDDETPVSRHDVSAGDFAFVPCWTEHQLLNNSDEEVVWVVIRSGSSPTVVELTEWGGPEAKTATEA